ncbi:hypothetical protein ALC60_14724 [Trachymyrmex zeteki]|uniref:Uncharacterized protein n=1 Tax=Mycetomoellerius zeteki TaxID=64791 RepID=A0A151WER8_9HYME|nr:hypothetical protein ALC60_14724 [Trachymyrmex zeteki]
MRELRLEVARVNEAYGSPRSKFKFKAAKVTALDEDIKVRTRATGRVQEVCPINRRTPETFESVLRFVRSLIFAEPSRVFPIASPLH